MSMFQSTATVTSIFSVSRSRPVAALDVDPRRELDVGHPADAQAAIEHRRIVGQPLHVAGKQNVVIGVGRPVAGPQLPDRRNPPTATMNAIIAAPIST